MKKVKHPGFPGNGRHFQSGQTQNRTKTFYTNSGFSAVVLNTPFLVHDRVSLYRALYIGCSRYIGNILTRLTLA